MEAGLAQYRVGRFCTGAGSPLGAYGRPLAAAGEDSHFARGPVGTTAKVEAKAFSIRSMRAKTEAAFRGASSWEGCHGC